MSSSHRESPMMAQYRKIKSRYRNALLFYRMGDFYEMFFDDAIVASEALDIVLTKRGKSKSLDIPMCGVPVHSAEGYLQTLIRKGFHVAVCEQVEDPKEAKRRGSKAIVKREVIRLLTPGTLTEDALLDARKHNYLAAVTCIRNRAALAWADISSGDLRVVSCPMTQLEPHLARIAPSELLVCEPSPSEALSIISSNADAVVTPLPPLNFDSREAEIRLHDLYSVASLEGFGSFNRTEVSALGAIISYLDLTQKGNLPLLGTPVRERAEGVMQIDAATRRNLELAKALSGEREGSLLSVLDRTVTSAGARLLERRIASPSTDLELIERQLDGVERFVVEVDRRQVIRKALRRFPDLERALSRLALDRAGPRDLSAMRDGLAQVQFVYRELSGQIDWPEHLLVPSETLKSCTSLQGLLDEALVEQPPATLREGGLVAAGYDEELDEARRHRDEGHGVITALQARYATLTGIATLKIKFNNILGYFVETSAASGSKLMNQDGPNIFVHRQTMANSLRFTTSELAEAESRIINAGNLSLEIETRIFSELRDLIVDRAPEIGIVARAMAEIDLAASLGDLAATDNWRRPVLTEDESFEVEGGRHPVVEHALRRDGVPFVANRCVLSENVGDKAKIRLVTGPNMSGKSTYLRQNALIAILAQSGSFVPADSARMGYVTQLFSRVGAADDLARGRSTFMVEMVETAAILNQAGSRAFVILDEIGRGTSTYDGLSIAWASLEYLHEVNRCRALFATHYHELTELSRRLERLSNAAVAVREWEGELVFLHEVQDGASDRSYGVQVAKLAGMPWSVISRAEELLRRLERGGGQRIDGELTFSDLPSFTSQTSASSARESVVEQALRQINPDALTPLGAIEAIYELKSLLGD